MDHRLTRRSLLQLASAGGLSLLNPLSGVSQTLAAEQNAASPPLKITGVRAFQPPTPGSPPDWRTQLGQIIVEVEAEGGLTGVGVGGGGAAGIHVIQTVIRDLLVGCDATPVEQLYHAMSEHTQFYGRKGLVVMATSGVDLALWDLRGKRAGQPVAKLLKPDIDLSAPLPTYSTVFGEGEVAQALAAGHSALKLHVESLGRNPPVSKVVDLVRGMRQRLGPDKPLMIDAFCMWDVETTLRVAEAIAPLDITFLEESLPPDDLDGYAELVKRVSIPIAGGEHEYTERGFKELIDRKLHAVLQPDINWCGGLTAVVEIYRLAKAAGIQVCLHRGSEPFGLHALAALDAKPLAESGRPWFKLRGAPRIEGGVIRLSNTPGFGISAALE